MVASNGDETEHSTKLSNGQIFLAVHKEQEDAQDMRATVGIEGDGDGEGKTTDPQSQSASRARPPIHKNHMRWIGRADQTQKPHVTKNHKSAHTRTTQEPQRAKTRKTACRAGFTMIRPTRTTKTTRTTEPCGSSRACGYLGGYSLYFYIILYIYKSKCA